MTRIRRFSLLSTLALLIAGVFLGGVWGSWFQTEVSVAPVIRGTAVQAVPGVVRIAAERTMEVRTETGGRIAESLLELGGRVTESETLFRLDETEVLRALERVRVDLEAEMALREVGSVLRHDLEEAREEFERKEELHGKGQFSRRELDAQKRRVSRLEDEVALERIRENRRIELLQNEMERLKDELKKMVVHAPLAGNVTEIFAHVGDVVGPRTPVARLLSEERVIEATLSEENFAGLKTGLGARVRFLSYGPRIFPAEVVRVLPAANPDTQRYTVHLEVDMPTEMMTPGLTGEVSIVLGEREEALIVPRRALMGREVFVLREGRVGLVPVETGFVSLNHVEILSGLGEGDQVVVENLDRLRDGDRVRLKK